MNGQHCRYRNSLLKNYLIFAESQAENKKNFRKIDIGDFHPAAHPGFPETKNAARLLAGGVGVTVISAGFSPDLSK